MAVFAQYDTPFGSILDVPGVHLGHHERRGRGWQTGTTVVLVPRGATPGVDVRGGGPGTRETDALRPENLIEQIHAVTLTGGSAYGLAAADGVVRVLEEARLGFPIKDHVVPVVPGAVVFDLARGGSFANRPDATFGERAARAALRGRTRPAWGSVGAGTGAQAGGLQGGVGTASAQITIGAATVTVGAVAVVNSNGSPIDPDTGLPWVPGPGLPRRVSAAARTRVREAGSARPAVSLNTTIGVIATDVALDKAMSSKLAAVGHDGLARAIRPAHAMTDGDSVFALATGVHPLVDRIRDVNLVLAAGAEVFALACTHAVVAASTLGEAAAWVDLVAE
ncbi:MAG: P1 family peptidase [Ilumatobacter sp.]